MRTVRVIFRQYTFADVMTELVCIAAAVKAALWLAQYIIQNFGL